MMTSVVPQAWDQVAEALDSIPLVGEWVSYGFAKVAAGHQMGCAAGAVPADFELVATAPPDALGHTASSHAGQPRLWLRPRPVH